MLSRATVRLPPDRRSQQGGTLFLGSLFIFFLASLLLYAVYAFSRRNDVQSDVPLPLSFLLSSACLLAVSGLVHWATRSVRRDRRSLTAWLLGISAAAAAVFMAVQFWSMRLMFTGAAMSQGFGRGVVGMVAVLAFLHALHVAGGVIALGVVTVRAQLGHYDHERHWPVDFTAHYWHFLDLVWLCMLTTFYFTTGGFQI